MVMLANNYKNMIGLKFGRLTVIKDSGQRSDRKVIWECLCECGNIKNIIGKNLRSGNTKSCGCLSNEVRGKQQSKDKTGNIYGRLKVIKCLGTEKNKRRWLCECSCGKTKSISGSVLATGKAISCGCYRIDSMSNKNSRFWKGGISKEPYHPKWTKALKKEIRERDKYICQECGKFQKKEKLSIHHIDYDKKNINKFNLISLCRSCHIKTNHNRNKWIFPLQIKTGYWRCTI